MGRAPCCEKTGLKKGPWTVEEDQKLVAYVEGHGHGSWKSLPKQAGLLRCGKSCRLRWTNYLRPGIKRGKFSPAEEQTIMQVHALLGNRWSAISSLLPKRTDNEIKNFWNTHLKKKLLKMGIDPVTHKPKSDVQSFLNTSSSILSHMAQWESARLEAEVRLARESKLRSKSLCSGNTTDLRPDGARSDGTVETVILKENQDNRSWETQGHESGEAPSTCTSFCSDQIGTRSPTSTLCVLDMHHALWPHGKLSWIDKLSEIEQLVQGGRVYESANMQSSAMVMMVSSNRISDAAALEQNSSQPSDLCSPGFLSESSSQDIGTQKEDSPYASCLYSPDMGIWKKDCQSLPAMISTSDFADTILTEVDLISEDILSNRSLCSPSGCEVRPSGSLVNFPDDSGLQIDIAEPQHDVNVLLSDTGMEKHEADYWEFMIKQLTSLL